LCDVEDAAVTQRQADGPMATKGSLHGGGGPTHGLASSKPGTILDIGINVSRYDRETGQRDSAVPRGSTITEPRDESSWARVDPPRPIVPSGPWLWESTRMRSALPPPLRT